MIHQSLSPSDSTYMISITQAYYFSYGSYCFKDAMTTVILKKVNI